MNRSCQVPEHERVVEVRCTDRAGNGVHSRGEVQRPPLQRVVDRTQAETVVGEQHAPGTMIDDGEAELALEVALDVRPPGVVCGGDETSMVQRCRIRRPAQAS